MMKFQISKQIIVGLTGAQIITVGLCRVILAYKVIVTNSWMGDCGLCYRVDCSARYRGGHRGAPAHTRASGYV